MNIENSKSIRDGLQKGFRDGTSKMAQRRCYGYDIGSDGELVINPDEAAVVRWIFDRVGGSKIKNDGFMDRYLYSDSHEAIISDEMFKAVQEERVSRKSQIESESKSLTQAIFTIF